MISYLFYREITVEILFIFDLILALIMARYIYYQRLENPRWWSIPYIQGACALLLHIGGLMIVRLWSIATFVYMAHGGSIFDLENQWPISFVGTGISVIGLLWLVRIFTPDEWGEYGWLCSCAIAAVFVGGMRLLY